MPAATADSQPPSSALTTADDYEWPTKAAIWAVATLPMCGLAWWAIPRLIARSPLAPASWYWLAMTLNAVFLSALALWLVRRELGGLDWPLVRPRIGLETPRSSWRWIRAAPFALSFCLSLVVGTFVSVLIPLVFLTWPSFTNPVELSSRAHAGQWVWAGLVLAAWALNAGAEELLFRGVLLPRMQASRAGWLRNAAWFTFYHLHKPWAIPFRLIDACLIAWPARRYRSLWMALAVRSCEGLGMAALIWMGVGAAPLHQLPTELPEAFVANRPGPLVFTRGALQALPAYDPNPRALWRVDVRGRDLSSLDLSSASTALFTADFDSRTRWPGASRMPREFDPAHVMELGKHPGPGVRQLHQRGITGRGVSVAIIDQPFLTGHQEYQDRLRWYEEMVGSPVASAEMHGPAVASIALGKTIGVAPEASLYYLSDRGRGLEEGMAFWSTRAVAIRRLLEINARLPQARKIRVISLSVGWSPGVAGYYEIQAAVREARKAGILVLCTSLEEFSRYRLLGLGRDPLADPDRFDSYKPGGFLARSVYAGWRPKNALWVPMDCRATASPTGTSEYVYYPRGGLSWVVPYVAGAYALAAQVDPAITPERFWTLALRTGRTLSGVHNGRAYTLSSVLDVPALIEAVRPR